ncbi:MAG TPA: glutamate mutase L, partial [Anaerolineales bacterium]|nr:glutamate mutase L [Anaerolineales bacterium]
MDAKSLLAIDVGAVRTRAMLFDAVEGKYRFLAEGSGPTTIGAPVRDVSEGVRRAIDQLQMIAGRQLIDEDERLISPTSSSGLGVDAVVATFGAGPPVKVFAVGLLEDVSLESAKNLVASSHARLVGTISMNDRRKVEEQIDLILRIRPDLILVAGGTDSGATHSVLNLIEPVGLACYLMGGDSKPEILYAGNEGLAEEVKARIGSLAPVHFAPNVRPDLDHEQLGPAQARMVEVLRHMSAARVQGMPELIGWTGGVVLPSSAAFGRVIRFLSRVYDPSKGVLGIHLAGSALAVAASFSGNLRLSVYPEFGMGAELPQAFSPESLNRVIRWLPFPAREDDVLDYLHNRSLYPESVAATEDEMALDLAIARELIGRSLQKASSTFPESTKKSGSDLLPWFEPIIAVGEILSRTPTHGQALLALLDGIQPTGVTTIVVDQNNLTTALGAAAGSNPLMVVQVLEAAGTFLNLGTVISPVCRARPGSPVLQARLVYEDGSEVKAEVKQGTIEALRL